MPAGIPPRPFFSCFTVLARRQPRPRRHLPLPELRPGAALGSEGCGPPLPAWRPVLLAQGGAFTQTMWPGHLLVGPNSTSGVSDSFVAVFPAMILRPQHDSHQATKAQEDPRPLPSTGPSPGASSLLPAALIIKPPATAARVVHMPPCSVLWVPW